MRLDIFMLSTLLAMVPGALQAQPQTEAHGPSSSSAAAAPADQELEPQVTIIHRGQTAIEEYRHNGMLYMIKVTPAKGLPYYLVDSDGDGSFDIRRRELDPDVVTPQWILIQW